MRSISVALIPHLKTSLLAVSLSAAVLLPGCATDRFGPEPTARSEAPRGYTSGAGVVESLDVVSGKDPGLVGALIGGVVGGVLGNQVGGGKGRTIATIGGTLGGAYAGRGAQHRFSNNERLTKITVQMDNGGRQTIAMESPPPLQVGDRVTIDQSGQIFRSSR